MDIREARFEADALLKIVIQSQPGLVVSGQGHHQADGAKVAEFCSTFIDTYAKYLVKRPETAG